MHVAWDGLRVALASLPALTTADAPTAQVSTIMLSASQPFSLFMLVLIFLEHAIQYSMVITYFNYIISSSGAEGVAPPSPSPSSLATILTGLAASSTPV